MKIIPVVFMLLVRGIDSTLLRNAYSTNTSSLREKHEPIKCISIYGLETNLKNTVCSWKHPAEYYMTKVKELGFNSIRIPVSLQYIVENNFQVLDTIYYTAELIGLKVVLDFHRVSNNRQEEDPDVGIREYNGIQNRQDYINQVIKIISRYEKYTCFIGINSWNEYTATNKQYKEDWDAFVFNAIEASFPNRFLYYTTGLLWGGLLQGYSIESLPYHDRILYSVHKYHFSGTGDRSDWDNSFGNSFPPSKLVVGEWGFRDPEDMEFGRQFTDYLLEKKIYNQCFWTIAHSGDTGGLWYDDCENINWNKYNIIKKML